MTSSRNTTDYQRTLEGWPLAETVHDPSGDPIWAIRRQFDDEGRVLTECQPVKNPSACDFLATSAVVPLGSATVVDDSNFLLTRYRYTDEGAVSHKVDPANALMEHPEGGTTFAAGGGLYTTSSTWTATAEGWQRDVTYPSGKRLTRRFDNAGRLDAIDVGSREIDFHWTGEIYEGRTHQWSSSATVDPMRQILELDGLGRATRLGYEMLDRTGSGAPSNPSWADRYCYTEPVYDAAKCGAPLFEQSIARDVMGRARSVQSLWGHPEGGLVAERAVPWRGYEYDLEGRLTTVHEHPGDDRVLEPSELGGHSITNDSVAAFVGRHQDPTDPITAVDWLRELDVGSLNEVKERASGAQRWAAGPRDDAHRLTTVSLDGGPPQSILHDAQGRVTDDGEADLVYGPRGRLLRSMRNGVVEHYVYDAAGRLAQIINGKTRTIAWDGDQMIAAMEPVVGVRWEALWGAHVDQLLEFENFDTGQHLAAITDHRITGELFRGKTDEVRGAEKVQPGRRGARGARSAVNSVVGWWNTVTEQLEHIIEYTPMGRVRLLDPDGGELCNEAGSTDCVRMMGLPQFGFASAYRSERSGLTHMRNRWYSTRLGQFLSQDPMGYADSYNLYAYASMDPINFWDRYGMGTEGTAAKQTEDPKPTVEPHIPDPSRPSAYQFMRGVTSEVGWTAGKGVAMANPVVLGAMGGYSLYTTMWQVLSAESPEGAFNLANENLNPFMRTGRAFQAVNGAYSSGDGVRSVGQG